MSSSDIHDVEAFLECLRTLPAVQGISFKGWVHPPDVKLDEDRWVFPYSSGIVDIGTHLVTATSTDMTVATAGFATSELGVIIGCTGSDITPFSVMPEAEEITFLPGRMFRGYPLIMVEGVRVRVYEERIIDENGDPIWLKIDMDKLVDSLPRMIRRARKRRLKIPWSYCVRFTAPLE